VFVAGTIHFTLVTPLITSNLSSSSKLSLFKKAGTNFLVLLASFGFNKLPPLPYQL
jgi:hypothetical protein